MLEMTVRVDAMRLTNLLRVDARSERHHEATFERTHEHGDSATRMSGRGTQARASCLRMRSAHDWPERTAAASPSLPCNGCSRSEYTIAGDDAFSSRQRVIGGRIASLRS
jgi:hypothetical protein